MAQAKKVNKLPISLNYGLAIGVSVAGVMAYGGPAWAQSCNTPDATGLVQCGPNTSVGSTIIPTTNLNGVLVLNGTAINAGSGIANNITPANSGVSVLNIGNNAATTNIVNAYQIGQDDPAASKYRVNNTTLLQTTISGTYANVFTSVTLPATDPVATRAPGVITAPGAGILATVVSASALKIENVGLIAGGLSGIDASAIAAAPTSANPNPGLGRAQFEINNVGSITALAGSAINAAASDGNVTVNNFGALLAYTSIRIRMNNDAQNSNINITNAASGQIFAAGTGPDQGYAIYTSGNGVATNVMNDGVIYGRIALSDSSLSKITNNKTGNVFLINDSRVADPLGYTQSSRNSQFINYGSVSLAATITDIAAPAARPITNTTTIASGAAGNAAPSLIIQGDFATTSNRINALLDRTNFINNGVINLGTGTANNRLTINGDYTGGTGSLLQLQASTRAGTADQLVITGNVTNGSKTGINVTNLTPNVALGSTGPVLVQVGGNLPTNAFTLAGLRNFGTVQGTLISNTLPADSSGVAYKTLSLGVVPNAAAASGPTTQVVTQTIAQQGTTTVLDRVSQVRENFQRAESGTPSQVPGQLPGQAMQYTALVSKDPIAQNVVQPTAPVDTSTRVATWARATGDIERRTGFSNSFGGGGAFSRIDAGYTQQTGALLGGADVVVSGLTKKDDGLILGVLGGYTLATVNLNQNAARQDYEGGTVGTYATYLNGPAFIDALFKVDLLGLNVVAPGLRQATSLQNYSAASNIGYRFPLAGGAYVEPTAGVDYVYTEFNRNAALTTTSTQLRDGDAFRGRIGARVGSEVMVGDVRIEPSITNYIYSTLYQSNVRGAVNGVSSVTGIRDEGKVRGEVQASMNFFNLKTGVSGFMRADFRVGSDLLGGGGRVGARYQW